MAQNIIIPEPAQPLSTHCGFPPPPPDLSFILVLPLWICARGSRARFSHTVPSMSACLKGAKKNCCSVMGPLGHLEAGGLC